MKDYSKYFGFITKTNGQPVLKDDEFRRMMNIVYLEGMLHGVDCIRTQLKGSAEAYKYDLQYFNISKKLSNLTGNKEPRELLHQMLKTKWD